MRRMCLLSLQTTTDLQVSYRCNSEEVPYSFDFDSRYDWPEEHDWVDPK